MTLKTLSLTRTSTVDVPVIVERLFTYSVLISISLTFRGTIVSLSCVYNNNNNNNNNNMSTW